MTDMSLDTGLFPALRAEFPANLDEVAIEAADTVPPRRWRWSELELRSAQVANLLASLHLAPQSRVAVQVDKSVEALILYLGVMRAGHVFLPLNTAYQAAEVEYFIGNAEPAVVVCDPQNLPWVGPLAEAAGTGHVFTLAGDGSGSLMARAADFSQAQQPVALGRDDLAAIIYTSGTTGRSKGAMLTHGNLLSNARVLKQHWGWERGDVLIHALPIFHVHGLFVAIHGALLNSSPMIWFQKFDAAAVVARLPDATVFMGVPTLYVRMLSEPALTPGACARMRLFISGSAPLQVETFDEWTARTGHVILERYGMSETAMLTSNPCRPTDGVRRRGTVGPALPGIQLRVVDRQHEANGISPPCATGEIGDIEVRGPNVFQGYWRMPEKTAEDFTADGWFKTGDVGKLEADGYVTIVGRSKDLVISGGYNVYPAEIEGFLNEMTGVAESAVVGVPHADFGEAVIAFVVPRPGAELHAQALIAGLKGRIASFKVPKRLFIVRELPRNAMGKVQKKELRDSRRELFVAPADHPRGRR